MLVDALKREREKNYQRIRDQGRNEERRASLQTIILELLNFHFTLTPEEQLPFAQQLATIENVSDLDELKSSLLTRDITLAKAQAMITRYTQAKDAQAIDEKANQ